MMYTYSELLGQLFSQEGFMSSVLSLRSNQSVTVGGPVEAVVLSVPY